MTSEWFDLLFRASWQGGVLLLLVLPILLLFGKRPSESVRYLLLLVILLRFLLPHQNSPIDSGEEAEYTGIRKYSPTDSRESRKNCAWRELMI